MLKNYTGRILSIDDEPRRPSERHALRVWLAERPNIFRKALLQAESAPDLDTQIENVDRIMLDVFNISTAEARESDIDYLTNRTVRTLVSLWKPTRPTTSVHLAGSQPLPIFDSSTRKVMQITHLR